MTRFWAHSLRRQLFITIFLLLLPVLAAVLWSGWSTYRERADELGNEARIIALTTAAYVNRDIVAVDQMASGLTVNPTIRSFNREASSEVFRRLMMSRPSILGILLIAPDGEVIARADSAAAISTDSHEWASEIFKTGRRVVSPMQVGHSQAIRYVALGYPVRDDATRTIAALGFSLNLQSLEDAFTTLPLPDESVINITDSQNRLLARSVDAERYLGQVFDNSPSPSGSPVSVEERVGLDGVRRIYGLAPIKEVRWLVSVGIPRSVAVNRAMSLWWRGFTVLAFGLTGWLIVALVLSGRFARSVSHLDAAAKRIASGDFSAIDHRPMPTREFQELQNAFDGMLARFNQTRQALDAQMAEERRIRQELQSLQRQVIRQERLAAVGQLVSGVAHEINNPLQAILGFAELLQMQANVQESVKADLRLIQKESTRACGIIRNLALFARQQPGEAAPMRLTDVISSVAELRQRRLETERIELRVEDQSTQPVLAVLTELQQVVLNFVVNAEQAIVMSGRLPGCITIRSRDEGPRVILEVEDTGPGIPPEHEAKLFQPFFTTKPVGQGTGLGLSVSYGIVDSLGGHIGYRNAAAGGAVFYFDLPAASADLV